MASGDAVELTEIGPDGVAASHTVIADSVQALPWRVRMLGGCACLTATTGGWIAQAQLMHALGTSEAVYAPAQFAYWIHVWWIAALPAAFALRWLLGRRSGQLAPVPWRKMAVYGIIVGPIVTLGGWMWLLSINRTPVGMNTAVYNASFVFVFVLSVVLLRESVTLGKLGGALLCLAGLVLIAVASRTASETGSVVGYAFLIVSMLCWSCYNLLSDYIMGNRLTFDPVAGLLCIGAIGTFTVLCGWLLLVVVHATGFERFAWPVGDALRVMLISAALDLLLNCSLLVGVMLTSALFMSLGSLMVIPCAFVVELALGESPRADALSISSVVLILSGCVCFYLFDATLQWSREWRQRRLARGAVMATQTLLDGKQAPGDDTTTTDEESPPAATAAAAGNAAETL